MKLKNIVSFIIITNLISYNYSNASVNEEMKYNISDITENNTSTDLFLQKNNNSSDVILYPNNNIFELLNNGYNKLPVQQNNNDTNNIINIVNVNLNKDNINEVVLSKYNNKKDRLCGTITNTLINIVLIPTAAYNNVVSRLVRIAKSNIPNVNTTMDELNNVSKKMINISFDNTVNSIVECIKALGNKAISISTSTFGCVKTYVVRKIWG